MKEEIKSVNDLINRELFYTTYKGHFYYGKNLLEAEGYHIPSLEENAIVRMQSDKDTLYGYTNLGSGNFVRAGVLCVPGKGAFLRRESLLMTHEREALQAYRTDTEFYPSQDEIDFCLSEGNSFELGYEQRPIFTNMFADSDLTIFAFGNLAKEYGNFLQDMGVNKMSIYLPRVSYINEQSKPFEKLLRVGRIGLMFNINVRSSCRYLFEAMTTVLGVKYADLDIRNEARKLKISKIRTKKGNEIEVVKTYTYEQFEEYKRTLEGVRKGELPASELEKVLTFFNVL